MNVPPQPKPPQTPLGEFFGPRTPLRMVIIVTLALAALVPVSYLAFGFDYAGMGDAFNKQAVIVYFLLFFLTFPILVVIVPGHTHTFRDLIAWPMFILGIGAILLGTLTLASNPTPMTGLTLTTPIAGITLILSGMVTIISVTLILNPFLAFGVPSNWMSMWLLFLATCAIFNPLGILAAAWMPPHRRLNHMWKPKWLPRLPRKGGFTLIELLITVALVSILVYGMVHVSQVAHRTAERQERWREATALAVDAMADLRSQGALPADGVYPVSEAVGELHPSLKSGASVLLSASAVPGARLAEVSVTFNDELDIRVVKLAALLPEGSGQ